MSASPNSMRTIAGAEIPRGGLLVQDGAALVNHLDIAACQLEAEDG